MLQPDGGRINRIMMIIALELYLGVICVCFILEAVFFWGGRGGRWVAANIFSTLLYFLSQSDLFPNVYKQDNEDKIKFN